MANETHKIGGTRSKDKSRIKRELEQRSDDRRTNILRIRRYRQKMRYQRIRSEYRS